MTTRELEAALRECGKREEAAELERVAVEAGAAVWQREQIEQRCAGITSADLKEDGLSDQQVSAEITRRVVARGWGDNAVRQVGTAQRKAADAMEQLATLRGQMEAKLDEPYPEPKAAWSTGTTETPISLDNGAAL